MYSDYESCNNYDENWEFNQAINSLISHEVENRTSQIGEELYRYKKSYSDLQAEKAKLSKEMESLKADYLKLNTQYLFAKDIVGAINKNNIGEFLKITYQQDFNENAYEVPEWFKLVINYYSNRKTVIDLLKTVGVNVPDWAYHFRLPFEWNEKEIDCFFETIHNHYVCNGCIYSDNIRFWLSNAKMTPIEQMTKTNYSEIPWQFLLRNPLLNSEKYIIKIADVMYQKSNGNYFERITDYQKLNKELLVKLLNTISLPAKGKYEIPKLISDNIELITNEKTLDILYAHCNTKYRAINYIERMPKKYLQKFIRENKDNKDIRAYISESKYLTKEDKVNLLSEMID